MKKKKIVQFSWPRFEVRSLNSPMLVFLKNVFTSEESKRIFVLENYKNPNASENIKRYFSMIKF